MFRQMDIGRVYKAAPAAARLSCAMCPGKRGPGREPVLLRVIDFFGYIPTIAKCFTDNEQQT